MDLNGSTLVTKSEILGLRQEKKKNQQKKFLAQGQRDYPFE